MRRRRIAAAAAGAALVLFALLVWPIGLLSGDDDKGSDDSEQAAAPDQRVLGQLLIRPQEGEKGVGIAVIAEADGERQLIVQAQGMRRTRQGEAYEVWLFNSRDDAQSMGAQLTDSQGNYQGAGRLPEDYEKYRYLDVSREKVDQNAAHSGDSVLRGRLDQLTPAEGAEGAEEAAPAPDATEDSGSDNGSPLPGG
jgi:hypothetical protein